MKYLIVILLVIFTSCECKDITINGKVNSHSVTTDRNGYATYRTVLVCDDGFIREKTGLSVYTLPIGTTYTFTETKCGFK